MDPKDPNNGGLRAKDSGGVKSKDEKKPGKVANTDQYGSGGAAGSTAVPGKKSGTEHLPEGRNGKESKAAENKAAGKSRPPVVLDPVQLPAPKDLPGPQDKTDKKGAAPAKKGDGAAGAKKKKGGGNANHIAGLDPAQDAPAATPFMPMAFQPASVIDVPNVSPFEPVVVAAPTAGKAHPTHEALRAEVSALSEQIKSAHDEILSLSKSLAKTVAGQLEGYAGLIDQRVQTGTQRVGTAYNNLSKTVNAEVAQANAEIAKREQAIPARIKQVRDAKADEIKATVTKVKKDTTDAVTKGPEAIAAKKVALAFADKLKTMSIALIADIKEKTTEGGSLTKGLNPKRYSDEVQFGGEGARAIGHKALVEDKRLSLITTAGKSAIGLIEGTVKTLSDSYRLESDKHISETLAGPAGDLDDVITQVHEPEQQKHLDAAATLATETLKKQVADARTGIAKVQKDATKRIATERKSAEQGAQKAGKALSDNIKHGAKEIESRVSAKGVQDATTYNKLNLQLKKLGKSKKLDAATKATLDGMKADLTASHEQNKKTLNDIATTSIDELKREKEAQYETAISDYEASAAKTKDELVGKMNAATRKLGQSFDTIGTSFDATVKGATEKMNVEFTFYTKEAHKLPDTLGAKLDKMLIGAESGLKEATTTMLEEQTVQKKLNKQSEPAIAAAQKTCQTNAHSIWDAMDGAGTDENQIYAALRTATPGEIVYIEGEYNAAYPKRGTRDYPSPLQADLDDELSGTEWDIAFAYVRHQRERALKLELDNSRGIFNDEEERIQDVLRAASDDELKNILTSADGKAIMADVKDCLSGCDLDVVNALTEIDKETGMPKADRKIKADAILVYQAMYGGTGIGTEEEKINKILESTTDPAQRKKLHEAYNAYIRQKDPLQARILEQQSGSGDLMDASFDDELSGGEWTETRAMSEHDLSQEDHLKLVSMAKVVEGAHGAGTDEDKITDNIETDEAYFKAYKAETDPLKRKKMAEGREAKMNARLRWLEGERLDENGEPLKDQDGNPIKGKGPNVMTSRFQGESINEIIKGEMGSEDVTFEELQQGKWGPYPDRGERNGQKLNPATFQQRARMGVLNLEYMVAQRKLQAGAVDPELLIAYACWGVNGTDETNLKKGLKKGSELNSQAEIKELRGRFQAVWGVDLMEGTNEIELKNFKQPTGVVPTEVDGKDWLEIRISLMGKPESAQEIAYVDNVRYKFVTSGSGNTSPFSHAREDMEVNHQRIQDECAKAVAENKPLSSFDAAGKDKKPDRKNFKDDASFEKAQDEFYASDTATEGLYLEENRLEILAGYAERSEMAFLTAKEAMADAIIMIVELIGAALITAASMGATSPMLAMFIGNMILAGMTIMMRKDMVGDAYGSESIGIDIIKGIVMAGIQAAGEAKVVADFAKKAGQYGGKFAGVFMGGAEKAGMRVVGKEGLEIAEQAALRLEAKVGAKLATEGGEKAAVTAGAKEAAEKVATKEAGDVAEKVATKEAGDVAEKTATKEAGEVVEKTATKEVAEQVAAREGAAAAKKTGVQKVESAVESGVKNVATTAMSDTAQFLMDEKTWEMKGFEAMFGPHSIGRKLLNSLPSAFVQGAVSDYIQNISNVPSQNKVRGPSSGSEAAFRNIMAEVAGNTAGFLVYLDNYGDAGTFWQELFKSNLKSIGSGGFTGYLMHRQRAAKAGRDFVEAFKSKDQQAIAEAMATVQEADGYMDHDEKQRLVDRIAHERPDLIAHLPDGFQQLASKQKQAGADVTGPGGDKAPITKKTAAEEQQEAAAHKQASDEETRKTKPAGDETKKTGTEEPQPETPTKKPQDEAGKKDGTAPKIGAIVGKEEGPGSTTKRAVVEQTNNERITQRAKQVLDALPTDQQQAATAVFDRAKTDVQRNMLERALAAGRNPDQLEALRAYMSDMDDTAIAKGMTGAGVIQFYHQSCVPTAYQIALADLDPYYAFQLRNHPEMVMDQQRQVLDKAGAAQTQRPDVAMPDAANPNLKNHLDDEGMAKKLNDNASYDPNAKEGGGMEMTGMAGTPLHKQLEEVTGYTYEVVTNTAHKFNTPGQDSFADGATPHDRIQAAIDLGLPVLIGATVPTGDVDQQGDEIKFGHAMVIVGYKKHGRPPTERIDYLIRDPGSGTVKERPAFEIDGWGVVSLTLPQLSVPVPEHVPTPKKVAKDTDESTPKLGASDDTATDPKKTWDDSGKQTEKPDAESFGDAHSRRSHGIKPKDDTPDADKWATPENRGKVPETVPLSRQEVRDIVMAKYGATIEKFLAREHTADADFLPLIEKLRALPPGGGKTEEGKKLQKELEAEWDRISAAVAKKDGRHDDSELRTLYNLVEKEDFKNIWFPKIKEADVPLEQQARLMQMYREELKLFIRDLMSDENSKEVLYLRDRFGSGDRRGGRFDDFFKSSLGKTKGDETKAYELIISSSMRSNEEINLKKTGYADGIDPKVGDQIRAQAKNPDEELAKVKADNAAKIEAERPTGVLGTAGAGVTDLDALPGHAKHEQESIDSRRREIHLNGNTPIKPLAEGTPEKQLRSELDHLWELREAHKREKDATKKGELKTQIDAASEAIRVKVADGANTDLFLDPHVAFALARESGAAPSAEISGFVHKNLAAFRKAQDQARQGADPQLRAKREVFEREIGKQVLSGALSESVNANLHAMSMKALDYIDKLPAARRDEFLAKLGAPAAGGLAGAVLGSDKSTHAQTMRDVLANGNARERMIALGNFPGLVANDILKNRDDFDAVASKSTGGKDEFGPAEAQKYLDRLKQYQADQAAAGVSPDHKKYLGDFLKPLSTEKAGSQQEYQAAKSQEMDAKLPSVSTEATGLFHTPLQQSPNPETPAGQTGVGESSSLARTPLTIAEADAMGFALSDRERKLAEDNGGKLPWVVGTIANVVDPSSKFIETGAQASLPQKAGISGTTFRFMEAAALLGGDATQSRLAMIGALQVIDAHTIYEIANASKGFGGQFDPQRPYDHLGISRELLDQFAMATGSTYAELNGETKANPPAATKE